MEQVRRMIPLGYRFCPTEGELVALYLMRKNNNLPLPCDIIHEVALYKYDDPDQLTAMNESMMGENNEWYFLTKRDKRNGKRPDRTAGKGYWKTTRSKQNPVTYRGEEVGNKMHLVFWYRNPTGGDVKTKWLMTEFRSGNDDSFDDWVLCKIYKRSSSTDEPSVPSASTSLVAEAVQSESEVDQRYNVDIVSGQQLVHSTNWRDFLSGVNENAPELGNNRGVDDDRESLQIQSEDKENNILGVTDDAEKSIDVDQELLLVNSENVEHNKKGVTGEFHAQVSPLPRCFIERNKQGIDAEQKILSQSENGEENQLGVTDVEQHDQELRDWSDEDFQALYSESEGEENQLGVTDVEQHDQELRDWSDEDFQALYSESEGEDKH